ncbi:MAG: carbohydrate ABC transporter permease, partial [Anaerolineae bacterium]
MPAARRTRRRASTRRIVYVAVFSALLLAGSLVFVLPFLWMLSTSLKQSGSVFQFPPEWIPHPFVWDNYRVAFTVMEFPILLKNTVLVTSTTMFGAIATSSLAAFSFARLK